MIGPRPSMPPIPLISPISPIPLLLRRCRVLLGAALAENGGHRRWPSRVLGACIVVVPLTAAIGVGTWSAPALILSHVLLAGLMLFFWLILLNSIVAQNGATSARLVPSLRASSVALIVLAFSILTLGFAALLNAHGVPMLNGVLLSGVVLSVCALMISMHWFGLLVMLALVEWRSDSPERLQWSALFSAAGAPLTALAVLTILLGGALAIARLLRGKRGMLTTLKVDTIPVHRRYLSALRRDCKAQRKGALLMHALGPGAHPSVLWIWLALQVAGMAGALLYFSGGAMPAAELVGIFAPLLLLTNFLLSPLLVQALRVSRNEQSLVRLAPGVPAAADINGALAMLLIRRFGAMWAATSIAVPGLMAIAGASAAQLINVLPLFGLTLAGAGFLFSDYSGARSIAVRSRWLTGAAVFFGVLLAAAGLSGLFGTMRWHAFGVASLFGALGFCWYRWRAMLRAPVAFPAGRAG